MLSLKALICYFPLFQGWESSVSLDSILKFNGTSYCISGDKRSFIITLSGTACFLLFAKESSAKTVIHVGLAVDVLVSVLAANGFLV